MSDWLLVAMTTCMMTSREKHRLKVATSQIENSDDEDDFRVLMELQAMYIRNAMIRTCVLTMFVIFGGQVMSTIVNVVVS